MVSKSSPSRPRDWTSPRLSGPEDTPKENEDSSEDVAEARRLFRPANPVPPPELFPAGESGAAAPDIPPADKKSSRKIKSQNKSGKTSAPPSPHYYGHRDRLRKRFSVDGGAAMPDYELLELVLFAAIPRRDVKPLAKALIDHFGSFAEVLSAPEEQLLETEGISKNAAIQLKIITAAALRLSQAKILDRPVFSSWGALIDYCSAAMAREQREEFRILFLDRKNVLIADEIQSCGTVDHTPVYPREVMKRALELGASALILVHNHPSGDPTPSRADIEMTRKVAEAGKALKITLHDHIIVGRGGYASFKSFGLL